MTNTETEHSPGAAQFTRPQLDALIVGALYLVGGIVGFFFLDNAATDVGGQDSGNTMLGLNINAAQNAVHIVLGIVGLICSSGTRRARGYGIVLAVAGLALLAYGVVSVINPQLDVLSLNWPINIVHGLTGLLGLAMAFGGAREAKPV